MTPPTAVTFTDLPHDMLREIAAHLPHKSVGALALASKSARDALVGRPSLLWQTVYCEAAFLASNDPAARVLRSRAAEVKNLGLLAASARVVPALHLFTSLESIVMSARSVAEGGRLLTAAAAACPRLATVKLVIPGLPDIDEPPFFIATAPQVTRIVLNCRSKALPVVLMLRQWNTPALVMLELNGCIPLLDFDPVVGSIVPFPIPTDAEAAAAKRAQADAFVQGVSLARAAAGEMTAAALTNERLVEKSMRELVDASKSVVRAPPRLRKVVVCVPTEVQHMVSMTLFLLVEEGVDVVYE